MKVSFGQGEYPKVSVWVVQPVEMDSILNVIPAGF